MITVYEVQNSTWRRVFAEYTEAIEAAKEIDYNLEGVPFVFERKLETPQDVANLFNARSTVRGDN